MSETTDHTARAQEIAEALRRAWGFDMRFPAGIRWLAAVIAELKKEAIMEDDTSAKTTGLQNVPVWRSPTDVDAPITSEIVGDELISTYHDGRIRVLKRSPMKDETP